MTRTAALALACLLPLTACSGGDDGSSDAAPGPTQVVVPTAAPSVAAGATLVLAGDGLALTSGGSTVDLPFGSGTSVVVPALAATLGEPQQMSVECGQGQRTAVGTGGFDLLFDGDRFVGWDEAGSGLATESGLRVGSTRADVVAAVPGATFTQDTLGPEFTSPGGLGGVLDGTADTAKVVGLTGGETCVAR